MSSLPINPFLEGSEQVPDEEAALAAKALAEEVARVRTKANEVREKAAIARAKKEAARKAEMARIEAEVEAARLQVIKTVSSIPKASDKSTVRPAPPPNSEAAILSTGTAVTSGSDSFYSSENLTSLLSFAADIALAGIAIVFTFLIYTEL